MKNLFRLFTICTLVFCFSCRTQDANTVKLLDRNFDKEVGQATNLIFTFDKDLVGDTLINVWDTVAYIQFNPPIAGRYVWRTPNELTFTPYNLLPPATEYTATFTDKLLALDKQLSMDSESKQVSFHTPYLQMISANAFWKSINNEDDQPYMHMDLRFNFEVDPEDVAELLHIYSDNEELDFVMQTRMPAEVISLYVKEDIAEDKEYKLKVEVGEGLKAFGGDYASRESFVYNPELSSPYVVTVNEMKAEHDGATGTISILTSQEVNAKNLEGYIEIDPTVNFTVAVNSQYITVKSEGFTADKYYEITVKKGLKGKLGGEMKGDHSEQVTFGKIKPMIEFVNSKGVYLSKKGSRQLAVNIINMDSVKVTIYKVYENNLVSFTGQGYYNYYYDDYYSGSRNYDYGYSYYQASNLGDIVHSETIKTSTLSGEGKIRRLELDFEDRIKGYEGLYMVEVRSTEDYWLRDQKVVAISDIGLIVKEGKNSTMVFANSINTAEPLANVELSFIGQNNQVVKTLTTDGKGIAVYDAGELPASGFKLSMITARLKDDFNYIPFNRTEVNQSQFDVGGRHENDAELEAYLYGDRDLYRPGETLNISCIIRDRKWKVPGKIPVTLKLYDPNGKVFSSLKKILNEQGSFDTQIEVPATAPTGTYTAMVYTSTGVLLNSKSIAVEEFMPDRIKLDVAIDIDTLAPGDQPNLELTASNFFGPPAADRNYQVALNYSKLNFSTSNYPDYHFSLSRETTYFKTIQRDGQTDENGKAGMMLQVPDSYKNMGLMQADYFVTVFDETGRPVNRREQVPLFTQDVFFGIKSIDYYNSTGVPVEIPLIAVDKSGKALNGKEAHVEVIKYEYRTVLSRSGSYYRYRSEQEEIVVNEKTIQVSGEETTFEFVPQYSGRYEVRVHLPGEKTYTSRRFYAYGWGRTTSTSFEVNNEGKIEIELDKESYRPGDKARVLLQAPFSGTMLITVEGKNVVKHFYKETDNKAVSFQLDIDQEHVPNMYITATLFRPHAVSDLPLTVAHGFAPVMVADPSKKLPIEIDAVERSRSKTTQTIKIKTKPGAKVTIAAVDEGILQLTSYDTPDPHAFFYQKRALEVTTYDVYPFLLPELEMGKGKAGGGMDNKMDIMADRINPLTNKRVKLVAFWSGILTANKKGEVSYTIDIPEFSGSLRIMAVGYKEDAFVGTHTNMQVADPIVVSTGLPRFLSPGDTVIMPVTVSNTTAIDANGKVKVSIDGPLHVVGDKSMSTSIAANKESRVVYKLAVDKAVGHASVNISVAALGETFEQDVDMTIRPTAPLQKRHGSGFAKAGESNDIALDIADFYEGSLKKQLVVSRSPLVQFTDDLDYLVRYPYGCVEQTISSVFPQLYFKDIAQDVYGGVSSGKEYDANHNIRAAISKLYTMQLYNGGLTYWPGHGSESWWGTAYATHFLMEAKKAGYAVNESVLNNLLGYLKMKLKDKETIPYYYGNNGYRKIAPRMVPYSLYILAMAGQPQLSTMNYYKAHTDLLSEDGKYLLAAAYALAGDPNKYREILPGQFTADNSKQATGGSFYSDVRDEALALNVLLEVDPDNPQVGIMAQHVSGYLKNRRYLNTQERSFGFLALGKVARRSADNNASGTVSVNGKQVAELKGRSITLDTEALKGEAVKLKVEGEGELYYFWETQGLSESGSYKEEDSYLKVRKSFFTQEGRSADLGQVKQNDLIIVEVKIEGTTSRRIENVAITDMLPAGFEIENSRITEVQTINWIKEKSIPDYMDIRDDRITFFTTVMNKERKFYYMVRAVTKGTYQMGPVGADAMYNGEYHSYSGDATVIVK